MHAVFLYHAIQKGMDFGIVNPSTRVTYADIPQAQLDVIEDVILNRRSDASERLIELANELLEAQNNQSSPSNPSTQSNPTTPRADSPLEERLAQALVKGVGDFLEEDLQEAPWAGE